MMPPSQYTPKDVYACDGVTFEFPVTFAVDKPTDVVVFLTTEATGATRRMVRNQDYVVREEDGVLTVVTRVDEYRDPWPAGVTLTILRRMSFTQPSGRAGMSPRVFLNRVESLTRIFQQLREKLDRTLHVGQPYPPFYGVSRPYPIYAFDEARVTEAADNGMLFSLLSDEAAVSSAATGGTFALNLLEYEEWPAEEVEIVGSDADGGVLQLALLSYEDGEPDEAEITASDVTGGELFEALLTYDNYPAEEVDVSSNATGGSLT